MEKKRKKRSINVSMIISLLMAITLWVFVMTGENPETRIPYYDIEVEVLNEDSLNARNLVISDRKDWTVNVELRGHKNDFLYFDKSNIKASVDLSGYSEGELKVPVKVELINSNSRLMIQEVEPREMVIYFDKIITEEKPFNLSTIGELDEGLAIDKIEKSTNKVEVTGPRTKVNQVAEAIGILDITGRTDDNKLKVQVELFDSKNVKVEGLTISPETVEVNIPIKTIKNLPIELVTTGDLPEEYVRMNAEINPQTIAVTGKKENLTNLVKISTKPIDINSIIENPDMKVDLELPEGVDLYDKEINVSVDLGLERLVEREFVFSPSEIRILNLREGLKTEILQNDNIVVKIMSEETIADNLKKEDISLSLNLQDMEVGDHEIEINLKNVYAIENYNISPSIVMVKISEEVEGE